MEWIYSLWGGDTWLHVKSVYVSAVPYFSECKFEKPSRMQVWKLFRMQVPENHWGSSLSCNRFWKSAMVACLCHHWCFSVRNVRLAVSLQFSNHNKTHFLERYPGTQKGYSFGTQELNLYATSYFNTFYQNLKPPNYRVNPLKGSMSSSGPSPSSSCESCDLAYQSCQVYQQNGRFPAVMLLLSPFACVVSILKMCLISAGVQVGYLIMNNLHSGTENNYNLCLVSVEVQVLIHYE